MICPSGQIKKTNGSISFYSTVSDKASSKARLNKPDKSSF
ncbi:hypothetical protein AmDm5_1437 [Acetobacter malorum]|nr:hypothetical protein AmDm5_1437 [Acetobacter malorum]